MTTEEIINSLEGRIRRLTLRASVADDKAERLSRAARDFEAATESTQTVEEDLRLNRMIDLSNRAHRILDALRTRGDTLRKAVSCLMEERAMSEDRVAGPTIY